MKDFLKATHIFIIELLLAFLIKVSTYKYYVGDTIQDTIFNVFVFITALIYVCHSTCLFMNYGYPKIKEWINKKNINQ